MKPFYTVTQKVLKMMFKKLYKHHVFGEENLPHGGCILAPNHASFFDPPLIGASCPEEVHYMARSSLFRHRALRWIIHNLNAVPVTGGAQDTATMKAVLALLKNDKKVTIFPEGLRTTDGKMGPMKTGVALLSFKSGKPIVPVYIFGTFDIWQRSRRLPKLSGKTACYFGKAIYPQSVSHLEKRDGLSELTNQLEEALVSLETQIARELNINP